MVSQLLALPPKILNEVGLSDQQDSSRTRGQWKSQNQNRKHQRKAERQSMKQRHSLARRQNRPTIRHSAEEDENDEDDSREDPSQATQKLPSRRKAIQPAEKKRKRSPSEDDVVDEKKSRSAVAQRPPSRAVQERLAVDDAEIEQLERKLGLKKGRKSIQKAFKDDGLDDLLGDLSGSNSDWGDGTGWQGNETREWLSQKRKKAASAHFEAGYSSMGDEEGTNHVYGEVSGDERHNTDMEYKEGDGNDDGDGSHTRDGLESNIDDEDALNCWESSRSFASRAEASAIRAPKRVRENPYLPPVSPGTQFPKYIPPSMRARSGTDTDLETRIRRKLQGPINRVTESNMVSIVGEIEKIYWDHARGHTNQILASLLLAQICDPTSKPDTLLVLSAGFITATYKVIGVDFVAHLLTTLVERFQEEMEKAKSAAKEQRVPTKETSNLITVLAEVYIFRVISCNLIFDILRLLLGELSELNAELLLRIVRLAGPQLRKDDPLALKDIVNLIRPAVAVVGEANLTVRTKFMIETISDLKNNKLKAGAQDVVILNEHVTRMKKLLGSLDRRKLKGTEPLRIGLRDIENADKSGKWWLVGASWTGSEVHNARDENSHITVSGDNGDGGDDEGGGIIAETDSLVTPDYAQLAREQGMNTAVRRAIFIAIVAAADFQDAYMRILKLRLNKYNRREIPNVLVQCSGAQQHYNPYYTLVAKKFCSDSRIKHALQDTVWTLFRRLGEPLFGEEPEDEDEEAADDRRLINTAKMVGSLAADGSISIGILKPLNLAYLKETTSLFVEVMFITVLQECSRGKNKTLGQALCVPFGRGIVPELARSVCYFLRKKVRATDLVDDKKDRKKVRKACEVAEALLVKLAQVDEM